MTDRDLTLKIVAEGLDANCIYTLLLENGEQARKLTMPLCDEGNSFPSRHTIQIFFLMTLIIHHFQLGMGESIALYAVAALVSFTRIYIGAHYPRDVIAGVVLGSV